MKSLQDIINQFNNKLYLKKVKFLYLKIDKHLFKQLKNFKLRSNNKYIKKRRVNIISLIITLLIKLILRSLQKRRNKEKNFLEFINYTKIFNKLFLVLIITLTINFIKIIDIL